MALLLTIRVFGYCCWWTLVDLATVYHSSNAGAPCAKRWVKDIRPRNSGRPELVLLSQGCHTGGRSGTFTQFAAAWKPRLFLLCWPFSSSPNSLDGIERVFNSCGRSEHQTSSALVKMSIFYGICLESMTDLNLVEGNSHSKLGHVDVGKTKLHCFQWLVIIRRDSCIRLLLRSLRKMFELTSLCCSSLLTQSGVSNSGACRGAYRGEIKITRCFWPACKQHGCCGIELLPSTTAAHNQLFVCRHFSCSRDANCNAIHVGYWMFKWAALGSGRWACTQCQSCLIHRLHHHFQRQFVYWNLARYFLKELLLSTKNRCFIAFYVLEPYCTVAMSLEPTTSQ